MNDAKLAPVITVDGPSGSGKGTLGKALVKELSWNFLDSGAVYRALAYAVQKKNIALTEENSITELAKDIDLQFNFNSGVLQVIWDGQDISKEIRTENCGAIASQISKYPRVRAALLDLQRSFRKAPGLVADGRDMGTVVFPDASCKIYLEASAETRAKRRYKELHEAGQDVTFDSILAKISERDSRDKNRAVAPLKPAPDANVIDTTDLNAKKVLEIALKHIKSCVVL